MTSSIEPSPWKRWKDVLLGLFSTLYVPYSILQFVLYLCLTTLHQDIGPSVNIVCRKLCKTFPIKSNFCTRGRNSLIVQTMGCELYFCVTRVECKPFFLNHLFFGGIIFSSPTLWKLFNYPPLDATIIFFLLIVISHLCPTIEFFWLQDSKSHQSSWDDCGIVVLSTKKRWPPNFYVIYTFC